MIQVATFIMTMLTLLKKLRSGFPSSPHIAMATPVTIEKTINPRMLVLLDQVDLNTQVVLSAGSIVAPVVISVF